MAGVTNPSRFGPPGCNGIHRVTSSTSPLRMIQASCNWLCCATSSWAENCRFVWKLAQYCKDFVDLQYELESISHEKTLLEKNNPQPEYMERNNLLNYINGVVTVIAKGPFECRYVEKAPEWISNMVCRIKTSIQTNFNEVTSINPFGPCWNTGLRYFCVWTNRDGVWEKNGMAIGYRVLLNRLRCVTLPASMANGLLL